MRSTDGDVVCATAANLFVLQDGRWMTPARGLLRRRGRVPGLGAGAA